MNHNGSEYKGKKILIQKNIKKKTSSRLLAVYV